jgi:hypothetical protein
MASYWDIVPRGIWRVADVIDAINAISDPESTFTIDTAHNRINVFGPPHKAVWIDLAAMESTATAEEILKFSTLLDKLSLMHYNEH